MLPTSCPASTRTGLETVPGNPALNLIPLVCRWLLPASQRELGIKAQRGRGLRCKEQLPKAQQDVPQQWDTHHGTSSVKQPEMPSPSVPALAPASHSPTKRNQSPLPVWDAERGWGFVTQRQLQLHHLPSVTRGDKGRKSECSETPACQLFVTQHGFVPFAHPQP